MTRGSDISTRARQRWPLRLSAGLLAACVLALPCLAQDADGDADQAAPITIERSYYDLEKQKPQLEQTYRNGVLDGPFRTWYENGQLQTDAMMRDGKLNGTMKQYDEDGHLIRVAQFRDDELHGEDRRYFETGELHSVRMMDSGQLHGVMLVYTRSGQRIWEYPYSRGKLSGTVRAWDADGTLISEEQRDEVAEARQAAFDETLPPQAEPNLKPVNPDAE